MKVLDTKKVVVSYSYPNDELEILTNSQKALSEWRKHSKHISEALSYQSNSEKRSLSEKQFQTENNIQGWLVFYLSQLLLVKESEINLHLPFEYYGITSLEALRLISAIEVWLGHRLSLKSLYEYPTLKGLAKYLASEVESGY